MAVTLPLRKEYIARQTPCIACIACIACDIQVR